ncbi:DNA repair exonuclease [Holzapfeliella sp. He02]|uniref:DNA repair exonuclease n=1 Tax=Holzapfeliella saturejae TaxID=3082953 RepID=A0ABU8SH24_9LACO
MKFLHIADAHLDSPFKGLSYLPKQLWQSVYDSTYLAFETAVDQAIAEQVDFVLVVGDTFDGPHPSLHAQKFVADQFERLNQVDITVFLTFGNHDYYQAENYAFDYSDNVVVFKSGMQRKSLVTKSGLAVDIVGFSYTQNHITQNIVHDFPERLPGHYTIGMIHGSPATSDANQDHYAPFELSDLTKQNYNYYALGHIHKREVLRKSPLIVYSGNLQGRHINEPGQKGCYLVSVDEQTFASELQFIETSQIVFSQLKLSLTEETGLQSLQKQIEQALSTLDVKQMKMIKLVIQNSQLLSLNAKEVLNQTNFLDQISQKTDYDSILYDVEFEVNHKIQLTALDETYFEEAIADLVNQGVVSDKLRPLLKKYLPVEQLLNQPDDLVDQLRQLVQLELNEAVTRGEERED